MADSCPLPNCRFDDPQRRAQGRRRGHAAAHSGAAGRGGADGVGSHRHPAAIAAAHLAPSASCWPRPAWSSASAKASWAFFRLGERGGSADAGARAGRAARPDRRRRSRATASGLPPCARDARRRRAGLFRAPRRRVGPHPQAARRRRGGRGGDPRRAGGRAVPLAARSRHRHRAHARTVRAADRARPRPRSLARHAGAGARAARSRGAAPLQRAPGRHLRPRAAEGQLRRGHHPPGAALPRRRRARDPRGGARAAARRPAAGRRFRAARSRVPARRARPPPARLCARDGGAMDDAAGLDVVLQQQPAAGAGLRRQDRGLALARARSAHRCSPTAAREVA